MNNLSIRCVPSQGLPARVLKSLAERFRIAHLLVDESGHVVSLGGVLLEKLIGSLDDGDEGCRLAVGVNLASVCPLLSDPPEHIKGRWGRKVAVSVTPLDDGGRLYLFRDETSDDLAGKALREAASEAEAARRARHVFMSQTAHDFRTPLSLILGNAGLLLDPANADNITPETALALETIRDAGEVLLKNVNDMLERMRAEAGKITADPDRYMLAPLLYAVLDGYQVEIDNRNIRLNMEDGLRRRLTGVYVHVDRVLMRKALSHLLGYILAICGPGAEIAISARLQARSVTLNLVFPTGIYDPEKVLEAFETSTHLPELDLTGLASNHALPLARQLVALHGGKLSMSRARGRAVRLALRLPVLKKRARPARESAAGDARPAA